MRMKKKNKTSLFVCHTLCVYVCVCVCVCLCAAFHEVSVYPKKELPFFILFTAGLCSFTALLALLTHQYPEPMGVVVRTVCGWSLCVGVSV